MLDGEKCEPGALNRGQHLRIHREAELPQIRFHDLRHTAATLLLLAGVHPKIVSERLGHASIEVTLNTYSHVLPTMQKAATDKLEAMFA
jgi:integrase